MEGVSKLCVEASVLPTEQATPWPRCDKGKQCVDTTTEDTTVETEVHYQSRRRRTWAV